jgi:O-antigen/teichoic acid export membrane protein
LARQSFKQRLVKGSLLEVVGFGAGNLIRLASTLILTRLLHPEVFGLLTLVSTFIAGLAMLSDVGIQPAVVQSQRGDERSFLDAAWSIQVIRGVGLWLVSCAIAWPLATFYDEPQLFWLIPVAALNVLVGGFTSMSLIGLRRSLNIRPLVVIEIASQCLGFSITLIWALLYPTIWAVAAGSLAAMALQVAASWWIAGPRKDRLHWDPAATAEILRLGRWIFGSSALSFVSQQTDKLLLGKFIGVAALGIYGIALSLADLLVSLVIRITHGMVFPVLSKVQREQPQQLSAFYYRIRLPIDLLGLIGTGMLMMLSQLVVDVMYDERYAQAGWMLQVLCVKAAMSVVLGPAETCLFSMGQTRYGFYQNIGRSIWIVFGTPLSWQLWGLQGVIWCVALSQFPVACILFFPLAKAGMLRPLLELRALAFFAIGLLLGWAMRGAIQTLFGF